MAIKVEGIIEGTIYPQCDRATQATVLNVTFINGKSNRVRGNTQCARCFARMTVGGLSPIGRGLKVLVKWDCIDEGEIKRLSTLENWSRK